MPTATITKKPKPRERLLEAARRIFYEKGYAIVGINEVIAAADVAKASFYHHFPSKDELILACLDADHQEAIAGLRATGARQGTPKERILGVFHAAAAMQTQLGFQGCHFTNALASLGDSIPRVREIAACHIDALSNLFNEHLRAWAVAEGLTGIDIPCLSRALTSLLQGAILRAQVSRETSAFPEAEVCATAMLKCAADQGTKLF